MKRLLSILMLVAFFSSVFPMHEAAAATTKQGKIVSEVKKTIGVKYKIGGTTTKGFDCSGLTQYVYKKSVKTKLPRTSQQQGKFKAKKVNLKQVQPGDLLFYGSEKAAYHVGVYIGQGKMVHAPKPGDRVKVTQTKYYKPSFAKRVVK